MAGSGTSLIYMYELPKQQPQCVNKDIKSIVVLDMRAWRYLRWSMNVHQALTQKMISEPQKGIEPTTSSWPVRGSNHGATDLQMASLEHVWHMCSLSSSHDMLIMILGQYIL